LKRHFYLPFFDDVEKNKYLKDIQLSLDDDDTLDHQRKKVNETKFGEMGKKGKNRIVPFKLWFFVK
jgi:hypothetical protein